MSTSAGADAQAVHEFHLEPREEGQRPRPTRLQLHVRNILRRTHLLCLTVVACYIAAHYHGAEALVAVMLTGGYIAEISPASWKRRFFCEFVFLFLGTATFVWACYLDGTLDWANRFSSTQAFGGWIRMLLAYYVLIPARFGMLRNVAALAATEMLIAGHLQSGFWGYMVLIPGALMCLLLDNWTKSMHNPLSRHVLIGHTRPRTRPLRSALMLVLISIVAISVGLGIQFLGRTTNRSIRGGTPSSPSATFTGLSQSMDLDNPEWIQQDEGLVARLVIDPDTPLPLPVYLRATTMPQVVTRGPFLSWTSRPGDEAGIGDNPVLHHRHEERLGTISRGPGYPNTVFVPNGCCRVHLDHVLRDRDGNLYQQGLGVGGSATYDVDLGGPETPQASISADDLIVYREVPAALAESLRQRLENLAVLENWQRQDDPVQAAQTISRWLWTRCQYAINDLPQDPWETEGGTILVFLFGPEKDRIGHCQYFATAATLLLRLTGFTARPVAGYTSSERIEDQVLFRGLHAHAWLEVYDPATGIWHLMDATPGNHLAVRTADTAYGIGSPHELAHQGQQIPSALATAPPTVGYRSMVSLGAWIAGVVLASIGAVILILHVRRRLDPQQDRLLRRSTEDLLSLAHSLGIRIEQHDTLSVIIDRISQRSGLDLSRELAAHLLARYGEGPLPPPWPVRVIRTAASGRASPVKQQAHRT